MARSSGSRERSSGIVHLLPEGRDSAGEVAARGPWSAPDEFGAFSDGVAVTNVQREHGPLPRGEQAERPVEIDQFSAQLDLLPGGNVCQQVIVQRHGPGDPPPTGALIDANACEPASRTVRVVDLRPRLPCREEGFLNGILSG